MSTSPRRPLPSRIIAPTSPSRPLPRKLGEGPASPPRVLASQAPTSPGRSLPASIVAPTSPGRPLPRRITEPVKRPLPTESTPLVVRDATPESNPTSPSRPLPIRISGSSGLNAPLSPHRPMRPVSMLRPAPRPVMQVSAPVITVPETPVVAPPEPLAPTERSLTFRLEGGKITNVQLVDSSTILLTIV